MWGTLKAVQMSMNAVWDTIYAVRNKPVLMCWEIFSANVPKATLMIQVLEVAKVSVEPWLF